MCKNRFMRQMSLEQTLQKEIDESQIRQDPYCTGGIKKFLLVFYNFTSSFSFGI